MKHKRFGLCTLMLLLACLLLSSCHHIRLRDEVTERVISLVQETNTAIALDVALNFEDGGKNRISVCPVPPDTEPYAVIRYPKDMDSHGFSAVFSEGCLRVGTDDTCIFATDSFSLTVYAPVSSYHLVGNCAIDADSTGAELDAVSFTVSGGASCKLTSLSCTSIRITVAGAAHISADGTADTMTATVNGAAALDTESLLCREVSVELNGAATAAVHASETLYARIAGVGSVTYIDTPSLTVKKEIFGAGAVTKKGTS